MALPDRPSSHLDFDLSAGAILADITVSGRAIKSVAVPTKQGILYVFDRVNGKPVWRSRRSLSRKVRCRASGTAHAADSHKAGRNAKNGVSLR